MDMDTPMPTEPTGPTERDLLMLSPRPRPRLIPPSSTPPTDMLATPTLTLDSTTATLDTMLDTPMPTTERGLLMLSPSPRPRLMPSTATLPILTLTATLASTTVTLDTPMPTTTERGPLMPSPRPMPTTDTTATPGPTTATATDTVDTEDTTGDKSSSRVQSKSSTRTSLLVNLTFHPSVRLLGGVGI